MVTEIIYTRTQLETLTLSDAPQEFCEKCQHHRLLCWLNYLKCEHSSHRRCLLGNYYAQCYVRGKPREGSDVDYNHVLIYPLSDIPDEGWIPLDYGSRGKTFPPDPPGHYYHPAVSYSTWVDFKAPDYSEFMRNKIKLLDQICQVFYQHGGKVYGGFVRDFLLPRRMLPKQSRPVGLVEVLNDYLPQSLINLIGEYTETPFIPTTETDFKDLDVWFRNKEDREEAVKSLRTLGITITTSDQQPGFLTSQYPHFDLEKYDLKWGSFVVFLDLVVSERYPVNDFTVNLMTFDGSKFAVEDGCSYLEQAPLPKYSFQEVQNHILNKQLLILPDYWYLIHEKNRWENPVERLAMRRTNKMLWQGYQPLQKTFEELRALTN